MANNFLEKVKKYSLVLRLLDYSKRKSIYGFGGMPIYEVFQFFISSIVNGSIRVRASSVAFNFFLGFFPAIIFLFNLIPYIPIDDFQIKLLEFIKDLTPSFAYQTISDTIIDIATNKRASLLSIGFFTALYFSTKGVNSLISAFNATALTMQSRKWISQQGISMLLMIILVLMLSVALFLIAMTDPVLNYLVDKGLMYEGGVYYIILVAKWIVEVALVLFVISTLYYFAPASKEDWRFFSAGSVFATILSILLSVGFTFYVSNFGQYNKLYGSLGTLIVIMMWIYLNAFVMILGFELNMSIKNATSEHKKHLNE